MLCRPTCPHCARPLRTCLCAWIRPSHNHIDLLILQHPLEVGHAKGSATLLRLSLANCRLVVGERFEPDELQALLGEDCALLYPSDADAPASVSATPPARLVLLDGTWRKSRKMLWLNPALQRLPRISLDQAGPSRYRIRKAQRPGQLATLEAACVALQQLERRAQPYAGLLDAFDSLVAHAEEALSARRGA
jgi:DTW domain-containing protein YfiP